MELTIRNIEKATDWVSLFTFVSATDEVLQNYTAGAHVDFNLGEAGSRSYSLIDWGPQDAKSYQIAVQLEPDGDGGSQKMHNLAAGDVVGVKEPKNDFELTTGPALLIGGGIGVTPLISMAAALSGQQDSFQLHYAARSRPVMAFRDQLQQLYPDNLTLWFDDETAIELAKVIGGRPEGAHVYVCGPKPMIEAVKTECNAQGIPESHVHFELFATPAAESGDMPFEVEIQDTGDVYTIPVGKTIIEVLEEAGVDVMYDCQRGDCGICQTDVISGTPDHRDVVLSDSEKAAGDVMQICVSRAKSGRLVLDI